MTLKPIVRLAAGIVACLATGAALPDRRISVHSDFEGGSIGRVEHVDAAHLRCALEGESDQNGRNRQANWYYFRLDGVKGRTVTIDLVNLPGEYNFQPNRGAVTADTVPVWSEDRRSWTHFSGTEYDAAEPRLRLRLAPAADRVWIAHVPPYTNRHLSRTLEAIRGRPGVSVRSAGRTPKGRPIPLVTIGDSTPADAAKKVVWLMFRQHSWEAGSSWVGDAAMRYLASDDPEAASLRRTIAWKVLPLCDPDGVARGGVRFNAFGFDLNRNWDAEDPKRLPEITAQRRAILDWVDQGRRIDLFLSLHNTETAEYLEGPDVPLLARFNSLLKERTTFAPTSPPRILPAEAAPGRQTVIQALYRQRKIPAFLMEQMIACNPKLGRFPTIADRERFGAELVRAIAEAVSSQ